MANLASFAFVCIREIECLNLRIEIRNFEQHVHIHHSPTCQHLFMTFKAFKLMAVFAMVLLVGTSCRKWNDTGKPTGSFTSQFFGPLAYGEAKVYDLIKSKSLTKEPNGVAVIYKEGVKQLLSVDSVPDVSNIATFRYQDTVDFGNDFWKNIVSANWDVDSARYGVEIMNGYDAALRIVFNRIYSISSKGMGDRDLIVNGGYANPYTLNKAVNASTPGITSIRFTELNSNSPTLLTQNFPTKLGVDAGILQGLGTGAAISNAGLKGRAYVEIPLSVWIDNSVARDTTIVKLGDTLKNPEEYAALVSTKGYTLKADSGKLVFKFDNQFPIKFRSFMYLLDAAGHVIDSVHRDPAGLPITEGIVGADGRVAENAKGVGQIEVNVNTQLARNINRTAKIVIWTRASTFDSQTNPKKYVRFYSDYTCAVRLIGDLNVTQTFTGK